MTNEKLKEIKERLLAENDKRRRLEQEQANACANYYERGVNDALAAVSFARPEQAQPAAVAPVVHGSWDGTADGYADGELVYDMWSCSVCGFDADGADEKPTWKYCPGCGAKMDA